MARIQQWFDKLNIEFFLDDIDIMGIKVIRVGTGSYQFPSWMSGKKRKPKKTPDFSIDVRRRAAEAAYGQTWRSVVNNPEEIWTAGQGDAVDINDKTIQLPSDKWEIFLRKG